jgi:hypothetical protein
MCLKNKYPNTSREPIKVVGHTNDGPAHHSPETIPAYGDETGYSASC